MILHSVTCGPEDAPAVVFLGSIASTTDMWLNQMDALGQTYRVIALDHRGHGGSPEPDLAPGLTTVDVLAADVLETLDSLSVDKFAVVGLSLGGSVAQHLALHSPRVVKAVFMCTAPYFGGPEMWEERSALTRAEGMAPMADFIAEAWFTDGWKKSHPGTHAFFRRMIAGTSGEGYAANSDALGTWDIRQSLRDITVPVLTIAGKEDAATPPETVHGIARAVSGETSILTVPGSHIPNVESATEVNRALRDFLAD